VLEVAEDIGIADRTMRGCRGRRVWRCSVTVHDHRVRELALGEGAEVVGAEDAGRQDCCQTESVGHREARAVEGAQGQVEVESSDDDRLVGAEHDQAAGVEMADSRYQSSTTDWCSRPTTRAPYHCGSSRSSLNTHSPAPTP
jgi:hypothetical protein